MILRSFKITNINKNRVLQVGGSPPGNGTGDTGGSGTSGTGGSSTSSGSSGTGSGSSSASAGANNSTQKAPYKFKKNISYTLSQIDEVPLMNIWTNEVLLGRIYENSENIFYNQNYIINNPLMFLIMRRVKNHQNTNQDTSLAFPFYISSTSFTTNVQLGDEAYTDDIILDNGSTVVYTPETSKDAINNYGGYYLPYTRDATKALKSNYVADKQLTKPGWVNAIFVFVYTVFDVVYPLCLVLLWIWENIGLWRF